ncbi:MAG: hypothetical protein HY077_08345 [Elusimicrobia bacterium]|nr:hypothetical protein [Elusimicrobiota bacterium]
MQNIVQALKPSFDQLNSRFEGIAAQLQKIDAQFDKIDAQFARIDARFDDVEKDAAAIKTVLGSLANDAARKEDIRRLEEKLDDQRYRCAGHAELLLEHDKRLRRLEGRRA